MDTKILVPAFAVVAWALLTACNDPNISTMRSIDDGQAGGYKLDGKVDASLDEAQCFSDPPDGPLPVGIDDSDTYNDINLPIDFVGASPVSPASSFPAPVPTVGTAPLPQPPLSPLYPMSTPPKAVEVAMPAPAMPGFALTDVGAVPHYNLATDAGCAAYANAAASAINATIHSTNQWSTPLFTRIVSVPLDLAFVIQQRAGFRCTNVPIDQLTMAEVEPLARRIATPYFGFGTPRGNCGDKAVFTGYYLGGYIKLNNNSAGTAIAGVRICQTLGADHAYNQIVCNAKTYVVDSWRGSGYPCNNVDSRGICRDPGMVGTTDTGVRCSPAL